MSIFRRTAMSEWQINLRELFKIVTAGAALYAWMSYWSPTGGMLVGILIAAAILFWPSRDERNATTQVKRAVTSLFLAMCVSVWDVKGALVGGTVVGAFCLLPEFDDQYWIVRYVGFNVLVALAIMLAIIVSVLTICAGR